MKIHLRIKSRVVEINIDDDISPVEVNYIQTLIEDDISKLEKDNPDTLKVLSTLLAKYCALYFVSDKKFKAIKESVDKRIDELIKIAKDISNDSTLF